MSNRFEFDAIPKLQTERMILREINREDLQDIYNLFSQEEVVKYTPLNKFTTMQDAINEINWNDKVFTTKTGLRWGIEDRISGNIIGTCGFLNYEKQHNRAEIGYDLLNEYWNRGIMTEVLKVILNFGFTVWGLNKVEARVIPGNEASEGLLKKLGFEIEGLLRQHHFEKNDYVDLLIFAKLRQHDLYEWN